MKLNEEHKALYDTVKDFAINEIKPYAEDWEKKEKIPLHELFKKMGDLDLLGITKTKDVGGMGLDYSYGMVFAEALGHCLDSSAVYSIGVQTDMATPALDRFGSDTLKSEFLRPAIRGDYVGAIAVSEHTGGSDVASLKSFARKDGDDYIINGQKMWITNATQADFFCALINTSDGHPHKNKSLIIIPANTPGLKIGKKIVKLGLKSSDTAPIYFDDVRVPQEYRIGLEGEGFTMQMQQFQEERIFLSASCLVMLDESIKQTIDYCKDRKAFGGKIIDNQFIQFKLAELQTEIESLRSLVYRACEEFIESGDMTYLASMAKLKSGRLLRETADTCLQYWGGMGFTWENPLAKLYRDGRLMSIGGGTDEIMLKIICKHIGIGK